MTLDTLPQGTLLDLQLYGAGENARAERLNDLLREALTRIGQLQQQVAERDATIAGLQQQVAERDATIAERDATIAQLRAEQQAERDARDPDVNRALLRQLVTQVDAEGLLTSDTQWFAIYKFAVAELGFPLSLTDFCAEVKAMKINVSHACVYENFRKVPTQLTQLAVKASAWHAIDERTASLAERTQLKLMDRLYQLLANARSSQSSQSSEPNLPSAS